MAEAPLLIYEVANFHGGDVEQIFRVIDALAPLSYPHRAIKFHPISADALATPDFSAYELYQQLGFDAATWERVIGTANERIGAVWIEMADANCAAVFAANKARIAGAKFQASMVDNREVLAAFTEAQGDTPVDVMVNVSGYELTDLEAVVSRFLAVPHRTLTLQIGFQGYPTEVSDTLFNKIAIIRARFTDLRLAFADHIAGELDMAKRVPLLAAALGCQIVEKHVCLDRANTRYDGWSALEPAEIAALQTELASLPLLFGEQFVAAAEREYLRKSLVKPLAAHTLSRGRFVSLGDVIFRRSPHDGLTYSSLTTAQTRDRMIAARDIPEGNALPPDAFRRARVACIVACRMKSSRLPKKALLPIAGMPSVERCLDGVLRTKGLDLVCLATSTHEDDAILGEYTLGGRALFHRGDPDDVLRRYLDVCETQDIDVICRVTADCPTPSAEVIEYLLKRHFETGADFTRSRREAVGTGAHIINVEAMKRVLALKGRAEYSEYMNLYFENNPEHFRISIVDLPNALIRDHRLTLDYPEDLAMFEALFAELARRGREADIRAIFEVLDECPEIAGINGDISPKYKADLALIELLGRVTRIDTAPGDRRA